MKKQDNDSSIVARAYELGRLGQWPSALGLIREKLAETPRHTYLMAVEADLVARQGKLKEAGELVDRIFAIDPGNKKAMVIKADILARQKETGQALALLESHPDRDKTYVERRLVRIYTLSGQPRAALDVAQKALRRLEDEKEENKSEYAWFMARAAVLLEELGQAEEAVSCWEKSGVPDARANIIRLKTQNLSAEKRVQEIGQIFRVPNREKDPALHALRAEDLGKAEKFAEAVSEWRRALELDPTRVYYLKRLAFAQKKAGETREALASFQEAVRRDPDDRVLRRHLYLLFAGEYMEEGIAFYKGLLKEHPGALWANGEIKKLAARVKEGSSNDNP